MVMPGCSSQMSLYVPRLVTFLEKLPWRLSGERNLLGPLCTTTLWLRRACQTHLTVVPDDTVTVLGPNLLSRTDTDLVAANAGMARSAAQTRPAALSAAASFFILGSLLGGLEDRCLGVVAPDLLERLDDLPLGRMNPRGVEEERHEVGVGCRGGGLERGQRVLHRVGPTA